MLLSGLTSQKPGTRYRQELANNDQTAACLLLKSFAISVT